MSQFSETEEEYQLRMELEGENSNDPPANVDLGKPKETAETVSIIKTTLK